jgi:hypothetical protein
MRGLSIPPAAAIAPIRFDLPDRNLMSSMAVLVPGGSPSATSAMQKLPAARQHFRMKTVYGAPALEQFASPAWRSLHGMAA